MTHATMSADNVGLYVMGTDIVGSCVTGLIESVLKKSQAASYNYIRFFVRCYAQDPITLAFPILPRPLMVHHW